MTQSATRNGSCKLYCRIHKVLPLLTASLTLSFSTYVSAQSLSGSQRSNPWFTSGVESITEKTGIQFGVRAKNVILFVGDGMGVSTLTASRILEGQLNNMSGEENALSFERFPFTALVKTYNVNAQTPDSAGTMTAMMSGIKTDAGVLGVDEDVERAQCTTVPGNEVITALELAEIKGMATGIVSTARITHSTPAAAYAKSADENWESDSDMPAVAIAAGCIDIASQLVQFESILESRFAGIDIDGIDVVLGGGRRSFLPNNALANSPDAQSPIEGDRIDGRNLIQEWQGVYPDGQYVYDQSGFDALNTDKLPVFGLFNESHMQYEIDRVNDISGEPSLTEMTSKALELLSSQENGFLLIVESGRIDHAHHAGNAHTALHETIEFSNAVRAAYQATSSEDTLILVTADHSHVFTIAGYPKRGNPILGKVMSVGSTEPQSAADGLPYTTLGYTNGRGFANRGDTTNPDVVYDIAPNAGRVDLNPVNTRSAGFHQEALVPLLAETHAGEDISLHATGPGAQLVSGVIEQNLVFHVINQALRLVSTN